MAILLKQCSRKYWRFPVMQAAGSDCVNLGFSVFSCPRDPGQPSVRTCAYTDVAVPNQLILHCEQCTILTEDRCLLHSGCVCTNVRSLVETLRELKGKLLIFKLSSTSLLRHHSTSPLLSELLHSVLHRYCISELSKNIRYYRIIRYRTGGPSRKTSREISFRLAICNVGCEQELWVVGQTKGMSVTHRDQISSLERGIELDIYGSW